MLRYIGGTSIPSLLHTVSTLNQRKLIPILDYAKESSRNPSDVLAYLSEMHKLIKELSNPIHANQEFGIAIKLSSFIPYQPFRNMNILFQDITTGVQGCKAIFLDAEQSNMINKENFVYNKLIEANQYNQCVVTYKTYQMYRRDSLNEIECDLRRFDRFGLKIVRGAYHSKDDKELFQTKKETDDNYNEAIKLISSHKYSNNVCYATHNSTSINLASTTSSNDNISFAQLLGMRDDISSDLVMKGYKVYKYAPYGSFREMFPYLMRRLNENPYILRHT